MENRSHFLIKNTIKLSSDYLSVKRGTVYFSYCVEKDTGSPKDNGTKIRTFLGNAWCTDLVLLCRGMNFNQKTCTGI